MTKVVWTEYLKEKFTLLYGRGFNDYDIGKMLGLSSSTVHHRRRKLKLPAHGSQSHAARKTNSGKNPLEAPTDEIFRPIIARYVDEVSGKEVRVYASAYAYGAEPRRNVGVE